MPGRRGGRAPAHERRAASSGRMRVLNVWCRAMRSPARPGARPAPPRSGSTAPGA